MPINETVKEQVAIVDVIPPSAAGAATVNSAGVDMAKFKHVRYDINVGAITGAGTLNAYLQSSPNANFNNAHNLTGGAITQVTNAAPNTVSTTEVRADQVQQQNNGDRYVRLQAVVAVNTVVYGAVGYGLDPAQKPASQFNLNSTYVLSQAVVNT